MTTSLNPRAYPPDYSAEVSRRFRNAYKLKHDRDLQTAVWGFYKTHPIEWINDWCVTFDPRRQDSKTIPFLLFKRQEEFVELLMECLADRESMLAEKCRDVGASWICCAFSVWLWIFHAGASIGWGSRKEEYVDARGNPKAIFPKMRQIIQNLPTWMLPFGFSMREHAPYMRIINPVNQATITGEAGDSIGRGGRTTLFFKDESAHYERPELIEAALGDNTDVQIDISSVNGSANVFYRRRMAGELWTPGKQMDKGRTRVFVFDWRDHPGKTQEWYDLRRKKAESEGLLHVFAQEVDRDYSGSVDKIIIKSEWIRAACDAHIVLKDYGDWFSGEKTAAQDVADGGGDKNALAVRHGSVLMFADHWGGEAQEAAKIAIPVCIEQSVHELYYDCIGVGAGFKAQTNTMQENGAIPRNMRVFPWDASSSPVDPEGNIIPSDYESPKNEDHFLNMKAQAWWRLRTRFYKTFRAVKYGEQFPVDELISLPSNLPNLHQFEMELTQATYEYNQAGKMLVDKKPNGALSPNMADSIVMAYCRPSHRDSLFNL